MLQTALDDMTEKHQQIQFLNQELQNIKQETLVRDRQQEQTLKFLRQKDEQIEALNQELLNVRESLNRFEAENSKLHQLATEDEEIRQENIKLTGELAYAKENEEHL